MAKRQNQESVVDGFEIRLPYAVPEPGTYVEKESGHLDLYLRGSAIESFRHVHAGCLADGAKMLSGRPVSSKADVIQYLFEQLMP